METTQQDHVVAALNNYDGENIWQDIICELPDYDDAATEAAINRAGRDDRFVAGDVEIAYMPECQLWAVVRLSAADAELHNKLVSLFALRDDASRKNLGRVVEFIENEITDVRIELFG